jgi:DNA adenine methylase
MANTRKKELEACTDLEIPISSNTEKVYSKPFLKWVGGKTQIIKEIQKNLPKSYNRYFEPFLGGGAVFFRLIPKNKKAYLSDINSNLIEAYHDIQKRIYEVMFYLDKISGGFVNLSSEIERSKYFLDIREDYNKLLDSSLNSPLRTAQLIFLNKTCFNGVYRENNSGQFNVPFGNHKLSNSIARSNILAVSRDLQKKSILNRSFDYVLRRAKKDDFIYFDPPYYSLKENQSFTKYHSSNFGQPDHQKLAEIFKELDKKGCYVLISNSDTQYIRTLYKEYEKNIIIVAANRNINCKGALRKPVNELLIKNY